MKTLSLTEFTLNQETKNKLETHIVMIAISFTIDDDDALILIPDNSVWIDSTVFC